MKSSFSKKMLSLHLNSETAQTQFSSLADDGLMNQAQTEVLKIRQVACVRLGFPPVESLDAQLPREVQTALSCSGLSLTKPTAQTQKMISALKGTEADFSNNPDFCVTRHGENEAVPAGGGQQFPPAGHSAKPGSFIASLIKEMQAETQAPTGFETKIAVGNQTPTNVSPGAGEPKKLTVMPVRKLTGLEKTAAAFQAQQKGEAQKLTVAPERKFPGLLRAAGAFDLQFSK